MIRRSPAQAAVAQAILSTPDQHHYGYDLTKHAGIRSGVLYPMLARWEEAGWLTSGWEDPANTRGRPPRRYYQLTPEGREALPAYLTKE